MTLRKFSRYRCRKRDRSNALQRAVAAAAVLLLSACMLNSRATPPASTEYEVKAAYLLNFGRFVRWPGARAVASGQTFPVCVMGEDPFGAILDATVRDEKIENLAVIASRVSTPQEASGCKILFLSRSEQGQARKTMAALKNAGVLTVSDMPDFLERGGIIQFVIRGNKVRFEVNLDNAQEAGLTLSSDLLKVADAVHGKRSGGGGR